MTKIQHKNNYLRYYLNIQLAKTISFCFDLRNILLSNQTNKTPKGDSVGCFGKGALH